MKTIAFILAGILSTACFSCYSQAGRISVSIDGWGNDTIFLDSYILSSDEEARDTIYSKNGKFYYTPPVDELMQLYFYRKSDMYPRRGGNYIPASRKVDLILNPGARLTVKGKARPDAVLEYTVKGSQLMEDMSGMCVRILPYEVLKDSVEFGLIAAMESNASPEKQEEFFARRREFNGQIAKIKADYIGEHPDRELAAVFVLMQPLDLFPAYYNLLTDKIKEGYWKPELQSRQVYYEEYQAYLKNKEKEFAGNPATDFALADINGKAFALSGFDTAGKYIVLDFWGSWCGPCIAGFPEMKKYYELYGAKLEIIGIACRDKEADWKKKVSENNLPWIHLINDESSADNNVAVRYAVDSYPTKIILSPDKTVLAVFKGEGKDFYEKLDELLK